MNGLEKVGSDTSETYRPIKILVEMPKEKRDSQLSKFFSPIVNQNN